MGNLCVQPAKAVADGETAPLGQAEIQREARLITTMLDGIGPQWILDPDDRHGRRRHRAFINDTIARWQHPRANT